MKSKTLEITLPDYLTVEQYVNLSKYKGDSNLGRMVHLISSMIGISEEEVKQWPLDTVMEVGKDLNQLSHHKEEFHSIIEWNGQLYGYANIKKHTTGEYIDLELLLKDVPNNLHKIAAIFYRPIKSHRFKSLKFTVKQSVKMASNSVENVFDWYELHKYNNVERIKVEEEFKNFPVHILLGAMAFFLNSASLYLINTQYSENLVSLKMKNKMEEEIMEVLSLNIGAGGGLSTHLVSPICYKLPETKVSWTLT